MLIRLPVIDPDIKLRPKIKLIGRLTVSAVIKLTLFLFVLFCIPIINIMKREKLKVIAKTIFLNGINII